MNRKFGLALGALLLVAALPRAPPKLDGRLTGAWATTPADCQKLFVRNGGGVAFRQPADQFAQAAIITPGSFIMPNQTCQVTGVSSDKGLTTLDLDLQGFDQLHLAVGRDRGQVEHGRSSIGRTATRPSTRR